MGVTCLHIAADGIGFLCTTNLSFSLSGLRPFTRSSIMTVYDCVCGLLFQLCDSVQFPRPCKTDGGEAVCVDTPCTAQRSPQQHCPLSGGTILEWGWDSLKHSLQGMSSSDTQIALFVVWYLTKRELKNYIYYLFWCI